MTDLKTRYDMHISMDENIRDIFSSVESIYNYIKDKE
jgi:acyl carrier protein